MASSKEYVKFILDQLSDLEEISVRAMREQRKCQLQSTKRKNKNRRKENEKQWNFSSNSLATEFQKWFQKQAYKIADKTG